ncbi:Saccharopine dehydrogenase protein [Rutstroemia sp. NJR-2017a WRK4]|nr:Saccharopine dehydrogenase protein [Rutstroemia sp. NJR-2017a WRK4]
MAENKKILVLGSGMVAPPCVEYLMRSPSNQVTIACRTLSSAQALASKTPGAETLALDVSDTESLDTHIAAHDLVISLVPYVHHPAVIRSAIKEKTNVVTTSYVSPAMRELEDEVKNAGIVVLNEVGVDPGVDHLYAIKTIDEVHAKGGQVKEFYSYCGGLPAPECADNPLGFKFSWSPKGAILSQRNSASFLYQGKTVNIPSTKLMSIAEPYHVMDGYSFVAYPNRDSVPFKEFYNIPEAETVIRGSLRYKGNPEFIQALAGIGWLDAEEKEWLKEGITWAEIQQKIVGSRSSDESSLVAQIKQVYKFLDEVEADRIISGMRAFGLFSDEQAVIVSGNVFDTLCQQLAKLLTFEPGERDLVMLQHKFVIEWKDGKRDTMTSTLELLGDPEGHSAMARSVGVTCGIATQLLLDRHPAFSVPGIHAPYRKEMCDPIREALAGEGIALVERVV